MSAPAAAPSWVGAAFYASYLVFVTYFVVLTVYYIFLAVVGIIEGRRRTRQSEEEFYGALDRSQFTLPVSIVIPAHNEEEWIVDSVAAALRLDYPQFEVIVVDDGSTDGTLAILKEKFGLEGYDRTYVPEYRDGVVREIYRSRTRPNMTVISKSPGYKKAGAVNAGLNVAKYKYVCIIDADTVMEPDALLKVMAHVHRDPEHVIGVGSYFGLSNGFWIEDGVILERNFSYRPILAYQNLEYIRTFIGNRIAWSRFNAMPIVAGGFGLWRRDVIHDMGGFNPAFTCEDLEYTFRAHDYMVKNCQKGYRILMLPYISGWTEGPSRMRAFLVQRDRWQRVTNETVLRYWYMIGNPRFGSFGLLTLPYFIAYEVSGVFIEAVSLCIMLLGMSAGLVDWRTFGAYIALMFLSQAFVSALCLFAFVQTQRLFSVRYILYLTGLSFVEFFWYRWLIFVSKVLGTRDYIRRDTEPTKYTREKRKV